MLAQAIPSRGAMKADMVNHMCSTISRIITNPMYARKVHKLANDVLGKYSALKRLKPMDTLHTAKNKLKNMHTQTTSHMKELWQ